ncbi:MAG: ABC transporter substrate-binding protein [Chloroflexota bacterium]
MRAAPGRSYGLAVVLAVCVNTAAIGPRPVVLVSGPPLSLPTLRLSYFSGQVALANTLDPAIVSSGIDADAIALTNANLVHILPNGQVEPDLATWKIGEDRLSYTFTIRRDARFGNGHWVTAQDAVFSLERALAPSTRSPVAMMYLGLIQGARGFNAGKSRTISGLKILDPRRLQIRITKRVAYFLGPLSYPTADLLDRSVVSNRSIGNPDTFTDNYITNACTANQGAGPFRFVCHDGSSRRHSFYAGTRPMYTLEPNPFYYGRRPRIRIELPGNQSVEATYRDYLAGRIDTSAVPTVFVRRWKGQRGQHLEYPSSWVDFLTPNVRTAPFDNLHCRLALAYAIDRETIAKNVDLGTRSALYDVVPRGMFGYFPSTNTPHYNPVRARAELARCPGRTIPFQLPYASTAYGEDFVNQFSAIQGMLTAIGMNVKLKRLSQKVWASIVIRPLAQGPYQIVGNEWLQDYPDPQDYCSLLLRSGQRNNIGAWHDSAYDRLVDQADVARDRKTRMKLYIRAQHIALGQGAWISVTQHIAMQLVKPYVHGLVGTEAYNDLVPRGYDWANVWLSDSRRA